MCKPERAARMSTEGQMFVKRLAWDEIVQEKISSHNTSSTGISFKSNTNFVLDELLEVSMRVGSMVISKDIVKIKRINRDNNANVCGCEFVKLNQLTGASIEISNDIMAS